MMTSLYEQLAMSYDAENTTAESLERAEQQRDPLQLRQHLERDPSVQFPSHVDRDPLKLQTQKERDPLQLSLQFHQRERDQQYLQHREKTQLQQREHIHQLQSMNNLLLDLPLNGKSSLHANRPHELPYTSSIKGSNLEADMSMSDLFGLSQPRGSLMGGESSKSSSAYRQQCHGQNHGYGATHPNYPQFDDSHGYCSNSWNMDMPGTPNSVTTPGSPSTPGSVYSNPYSYSNSGKSSSSHLTPSPPNRSHYNPGSSASPGHSPYYGRPIKGSPAYSDCSSPTLEHSHMFGYGASRSNSPADSETSGYNSVDGSLSDIMNCLSLKTPGHSYYTPPLNSLVPPDMDLYHGCNRAAAYQHMAAKKCHQQQQQHLNMRHYHCCPSGNYVMAVNKSPNVVEPYLSLDCAVRYHRNAAALSEATCTWSGELPKRTPKSSGYSSKVFLGGVPWDVTESLLVSTFKQFGPIRVEWPGKEEEDNQPKGYAYIIFESEKQVKALLSCCTHRFGNESSWYYRITPKRSKPKDVEVIPWHISDSNYSKSSSQKLDAEKTVFVGALHGMLTAEGLAKVMNDLFDEVIYAGIDTDKWKYPIGSARVTFSTKRAYKKACATAFVEIKTNLFTKKVQIDPYIEDSVCSVCAVQHGPYFCREPICSRYFCLNCWHWQHASQPMRHHLPMSRGIKANMIVPLGYHSRVKNSNRWSAGSMI